MAHNTNKTTTYLNPARCKSCGYYMWQCTCSYTISDNFEIDDDWDWSPGTVTLTSDPTYYFTVSLHDVEELSKTRLLEWLYDTSASIAGFHDDAIIFSLGHVPSLRMWADKGLPIIEIDTSKSGVK